MINTIKTDCVFHTKKGCTALTVGDCKECKPAPKGFYKTRERFIDDQIRANLRLIDTGQEYLIKVVPVE